ncbi:ATP-binding protein [Marinomonas posidonica]|uniref:histidine kinase n=1 Tax=Marinomonas posidonica (strain CECT 7376 / NCIMB 14433 / IVIA-Po-181) TaxID=491952 RepID=F6D0M9_MARPP|nr:ATP-binding protein [Marinomonas posidonica]AEF54827.1 integral membrane sensor signal transduction histidine kinase [Marinomonas posidonica IVIA-Po-181]
MFRSFTGLWLLVFVPLIFLLYPHPYNPIQLFNEHIESERYVSLYSGTFILIESQLDSLPEKNWPSRIKELETHFGYGLKVLPLASMTLSQHQKTQLKNHQIVFINDEPEFLIKLINDSNYVICLEVDLTLDEDIVRGAQGTLYLIRQTFENAPENQWKQIISELNPILDYQLQLIDKSDFELTEKEQNLWQKKQIFWRLNANKQLRLFTPIPNSEKVLVAQQLPYTSNTPIALLILLLMFVVFISISMFFWIYPLWRDLKQLSKVATQFGQGQLNLRTNIPNISVIASLSHEFNQMAHRIENSVISQRTLTNAIAHDLRQPLYRIRFALEMFNDSLLSIEQRQQYRQSIENSLRDLDHLINQSLQLSRYTNDQAQIRLSQHNIIPLLEDEIEHIKITQPDIQIGLTLAPELSTKKLILDPVATRRALNNLLTNAVRYANTTIEVNAFIDAEQNSLIIEIGDDGPGIAPEKAQNIFAPFVQLNNDQRKAQSGHGLGLAIVKQITLWHKGKVWLEDAPIGGAKFVLCWPTDPTSQAN